LWQLRHNTGNWGYDIEKTTSTEQRGAILKQAFECYDNELLKEAERRELRDYERGEY
jgi:hypothetical protein